MRTSECICGTCRFHQYIDGDWCCTNPDSDLCGCETEYAYGCYDHEDK